MLQNAESRQHEESTTAGQRGTRSTMEWSVGSLKSIDNKHKGRNGRRSSRCMCLEEVWPHQRMAPQSQGPGLRLSGTSTEQPWLRAIVLCRERAVSFVSFCFLSYHGMHGPSGLPVPDSREPGVLVASTCGAQFPLFPFL
jgi:hypothetical protein